MQLFSICVRGIPSYRCCLYILSYLANLNITSVCRGNKILRVHPLNLVLFQRVSVIPGKSIDVCMSLVIRNGLWYAFCKRLSYIFTTTLLNIVYMIRRCIVGLLITS